MLTHDLLHADTRPVTRWHLFVWLCCDWQRLNRIVWVLDVVWLSNWLDPWYSAPKLISGAQETLGRCKKISKHAANPTHWANKWVFPLRRLSILSFHGWFGGRTTHRSWHFSCLAHMAGSTKDLRGVLLRSLLGYLWMNSRGSSGENMQWTGKQRH